MLAACSVRGVVCRELTQLAMRALPQVKRVKAELDACHHALRHRAAELAAVHGNLAPSAAARVSSAAHEMQVELFDLI